MAATFYSSVFNIGDLVFTKPTAGGTVYIGQSFNIEWTPTYTDFVNMNLYYCRTSSGTPVWVKIVSSVATATEVQAWTPSAGGTSADCKIRAVAL